MDFNKRVKRFWDRVNVGTNDECWEWTGSLQEGYGRTRFFGKQMMTHRIAYTLVVGEIPEGLQLDHLCRNRACCNPLHLEPVTKAENFRRGLLYRVPRSVCKEGHALVGDNLYLHPTGRRRCRICHRNEIKIRRSTLRK